MANSTRNLSTRITVAALLYLALTAVLLTGTLHGLLDRLAHDQMNELGNALSAQLSETLKQPLINEDIISIQVILDNLLADTPVIARATVYSPSNRIIAQSQRPAGDAALAPYIRPVRVDDNMLAQLRLELDEGGLLADYRFPMWIAVAVWLLLSAALAYYLIRLAADYSRRLETINSAFTGDGHTGSELARLESSLSPFIGGRTEEADSEASTLFAMLAVSIPNLPKWRAQLNAEHFTRMLGKVDDILDNHLSLFKGHRVYSRNTAALLEFTDIADGHPLERAVNCANAFLHIANELIAMENIPFELRITAAFRHPAATGSPWFNDLEREACIDRLLDILPLAGGWELIIDKEDVEPAEDLPSCELEDLSAASVWQFRQYREESREAFDRQLEFLTATIS